MAAKKKGATAGLKKQDVINAVLEVLGQHTDPTGYWLVTYCFYSAGDLVIDTAIHQGTLTSFMLEINEQLANASVLHSVRISEEQYQLLEASMETVDDIDEATREVAEA